MQTVKSVSWVRMILAFGAILLVAGSGLSLAAGPAAYSPTSSIITGRSTIPASATSEPYVFTVTFNDGSSLSFPPTTGAVFTAVNGTVTSDGHFKPSGTGRSKINATFTQNGTTTSASKLIVVTP